MNRVFTYRGPTANSDGQETVNASQHRRALEGRTNSHGRALVAMLAAWEQYSDAHRARFDDGIGQDYVIGPYWAEVGLAIKRLLDGETGGLDCGSLAHNITAMIEAEGFKTDGYSLQSEEN